MKKRVGILLIAAMCLSLAACGGSDTTEETNAMTERAEEDGAAEDSTATAEDSVTTLKEGVLQVGMEIGYPPMEYLDADGVTPIGFDVDVAYALGEKLGLEVELVDTAWDGIFAALDTEKYDCVISSVSSSEERKAKYNLTEAYIANRLVVVVAKGSDIAALEDLDGKIVAVQAETTSDYYAQEVQAGGVGMELAQYEQVINAFDELKVGRADAVLTDSVVASYYLGDDADDYQIVWEEEAGEPLGICLKKGNDDLTKAIEAAIDAMYEDGTMLEIAKTHFGVDNIDTLR